MKQANCSHWRKASELDAVASLFQSDNLGAKKICVTKPILSKPSWALKARTPTSF